MIARNATLSIYGLYLFDNELFDGLQIPKDKNGNAAFNKNDFVDNMVVELSELELLYPDAEFMKSMIGLWSKKELPVWQKMYNTTVLDYNPIWNKDGTVEEIHNMNYNDAKTGSDSSQNSSQNTTTTSTSGTTTPNDKSTKKVSAYNESGFHNSEETSNSGTISNSDSGNSSGNASGSSSITYGSKNNRSETGTIKRIEQGNIGITTTQQMIKEERDVALFNIQDYMIKSFKQRFCLLIY